MPQLPSHATLTVYIYNKCWVFQDSVRLNVFECCSPDAVHSFVNDTISDDTVFSASGGYFIIGTLVIDANVLFLLPPNDNAIFMGPEARIMVRTDGKELRMDSVRLLAGCDYMWDGIYLNDTTKVFSATASSFSDAYNAIVADSGAALEIMDCQFFDNLRSIVISSFPYSYKASVDQSGHYWPLEIYGTEFWQQGYPDQDLPYPPYSSFSSISAIELHNADTILIGKLDSARNYFHDLPQAILVHNSASRVINNQFTQILPDEEQYPPMGAVHVYQDDDPWDIDVFSTIGTGDPTGRNYFDSCMHAITFRENPLRIEANDISDCWYGVHGINPKKLTTIVSNTFDQPSTAGLGGLTAITLANVTVSAKGLTLRVDSNEISGFTKGIWGTNLDKTIPGKIQFAQNTILFGVLTYGVTGIKLDNCDGSMVQANNIACITRPDSGFTVGSHNGIWVNSTGGATILSNNLLRMGHGIYTTGSDLVTYFVCNHLDSCYYGFHFGESTALSDQGIYGDYNTLNRWMGDYSQYGCSFWGRIMRSSNGITNGPIDWYYLNQFSIFDPGSEHCGSHPMTGYIDEIENNGAQADCDMDTTVYDPFDIAAPEERERLLGGIVRDWYAYDTLEASFQSSEQDLFFKITKDDPGLLFLGDSSDHTYIQYYNSLSSTSIPETYQVFSFIESGDLQAAGSLNDALADSTEWQHSRKMTNAIYINSWCKGSFMFASSDHDSLLNIAHRSPYEYGDGVFTARVLLGLDSDKVPLPARVPVASEEPIESGIRFYPNPASDRVCYNQNKEYATVSELSIEIFDLMGRLIYTFSETSAIGEHCLRLVYRTNPGVYIARINAGSNHLGTGKIIIK